MIEMYVNYLSDEGKKKKFCQVSNRTAKPRVQIPGKQKLFHNLIKLWIGT